jgi:hypothetical protein
VDFSKQLLFAMGFSPCGIGKVYPLREWNALI